jgi:hypothetical protein
MLGCNWDQAACGVSLMPSHLRWGQRPSAWDGAHGIPDMKLEFGIIVHQGIMNPSCRLR